MVLDTLSWAGQGPTFRRTRSDTVHPLDAARTQQAP